MDMSMPLEGGGLLGRELAVVFLSSLLSSLLSSFLSLLLLGLLSSLLFLSALGLALDSLPDLPSFELFFAGFSETFLGFFFLTSFLVTSSRVTFFSFSRTACSQLVKAPVLLLRKSPRSSSIWTLVLLLATITMM